MNARGRARLSSARAGAGLLWAPARAGLVGAPARALLALWLVGCGAEPAPFPGGRVVDLSHVYDETTVYWPTAEGFAHERHFQGRTEAGYWYEAGSFRSAEHGGTHLDAPVHFAEGMRSVERIPLEQLMGPGVVVDVEAECAADRDHAVGVEAFRAWEARHGRIPDGAIVLLRTGFGRAWPDRARYLGTAERGEAGVAGLRFPGLSAEAARWLVEERAPGAVGIDTASIDPGRSRLYEAHQVLSAANVPALENVARLEQLPAAGFHVIALPMKIGGGSGAPVRIAAILPGAGAEAAR